MRASCVAVISAIRFDRFSSYRNYRWGDSSSFFWQKDGLRSDIRMPNFPGGACAQTPVPCSQLSARNGHTSLK